MNSTISAQPGCFGYCNGRVSFAFPWFVCTKIPDVPFRIATGESASAISMVSDLQNNLSPMEFGARVNLVGLRHPANPRGVFPHRLFRLAASGGVAIRFGEAKSYPFKS